MKRGKLTNTGIAAAVAALAVIAPAGAGAATITPNISTDEFTLDNGDCSLREAVVSASGNGTVGGCDAHASGAYGNDTIVLNLPVVNYGLTISGAGEDDGLTGDLDVTGPVTVMAPPDFIEHHVITQTISDRLFHLQTAASHLTLRRITLTGGSSGGPGGAINAPVPGNDITLDNSAVANSSAAAGGGVRIEGNSSSLLATDSTFTNNSASTGGGLNAGPGATVSLTRPFFFANKATSPFPNGQPSGGGIYSASANVTVVDGTFTQNEASATDAAGDWGMGGAIHSNGTLNVEGTLFEENLAFSNGPAATSEEYGGALTLSNPGDTEVVNSTFYGNVAGNGNLPNESTRGGAIHRNGGELDVRFSTFLQNDTSNVGADSLDNGNSGGQLTFSSNLFAATEDVCAGDVDNTLISEGYNAAPPDAHCEYDVTDDINITASAIIVADPAVNGGPTRTIGLGPVGRGLDLVPFAECATSSGGFDARNYPRSGADIGAACDAGAYERTVCNGVVQNDDFTVCPVLPPPPAAPVPQTQTQTPTLPVTTKKCKKAKKKKGKRKKRCGKKKKKKRS